MKSYSQLNIHQKINAKASALNYGLSFGALTLGWYPMKADFIVFDLAPFRTDKVYTFKRK